MDPNMHNYEPTPCGDPVRADLDRRRRCLHEEMARLDDEFEAACSREDKDLGSVALRAAKRAEAENRSTLGGTRIPYTFAELEAMQRAHPLRRVPEGYAELADILDRALEQAAGGKGDVVDDDVYGWIEWEGKNEPPVKHNAICSVEFRSGGASYGCPAWEHDWTDVRRYQPHAISTLDAKERHANGKPFTHQPMQRISDMLGTPDGLRYQVMKKTQESARLPHDRAVAELLGAIVYAAGAILNMERNRSGEGDG